MDAVEKIIIGACITGIVIEAADCLRPSEKFAKQLKIILSMIFVLAIALSAVNTIPDIELPKSFEYSGYEGDSDIEQNMRETIRVKTGENLASYIEQMLRNEKISFEKISCEVNISEKGSIDIKSIEYSGSEFMKAERAIKKSFPDTEVNKHE